MSQQKGFLVSRDGEKHACTYTLNGKHVGGEISAELGNEISLTHIELEDGTLHPFMGTMSLNGEREAAGQPMIMKKFSGTL